MKYDKLKPPTDHYQTITDAIIKMIEDGAGAYESPWKRTDSDTWRPVNVESGKAYRGSNRLNLAMSSVCAGRQAGTWGTFKQWKERDAKVRKGEKASYICFFQRREASDPQAETSTDPQAERTSAIVKWYAVFSADQVDGWTAPAAPSPDSIVPAVSRADDFIAATGARITNAGEKAFYRQSTDEIVIPPRELFIGTETSTPQEAYYSTVLHELTHWTSAENRCNRQLGKRFGDEAYAMEELVAELGAAFLCADLGIADTPRADHAQYLDNWLRVLKADKKAIFTAASKASQAAGFLASLQAR
jgi:antirestriction protein ArdC